MQLTKIREKSESQTYPADLTQETPEFPKNLEVPKVKIQVHQYFLIKKNYSQVQGLLKTEN